MKRPRLFLPWLLSSLLSPPGQEARLYTECDRAQCQPATDRQTQFEFDQPTQLFLDQELAAHLQQSHRQEGSEARTSEISHKFDVLQV